MKKTGLKGYVYDFSTDYDAIKISDILDIRILGLGLFGILAIVNANAINLAILVNI